MSQCGGVNLGVSAERSVHGVRDLFDWVVFFLHTQCCILVPAYETWNLGLDTWAFGIAVIKQFFEMRGAFV